MVFDVYNNNSLSNCKLFVMSNNFTKLEKLTILKQGGDYLAVKITYNSWLSDWIFYNFA